MPLSIDFVCRYRCGQCAYISLSISGCPTLSATLLSPPLNLQSFVHLSHTLINPFAAVPASFSPLLTSSSTLSPCPCPFVVTLFSYFLHKTCDHAAAEQRPSVAVRLMSQRYVAVRPCSVHLCSSCATTHVAAGFVFVVCHPPPPRGAVSFHFFLPPLHLRYPQNVEASGYRIRGVRSDSRCSVSQFCCSKRF